eukprot:15225609-Heterocapsa_arctica.AAC.1
MDRFRQRQAQEVAMADSRKDPATQDQEESSKLSSERKRIGRGKRGLAGGAAGRTRGLDLESGPDHPTRVGHV